MPFNPWTSIPEMGAVLVGTATIYRYVAKPVFKIVRSHIALIDTLQQEFQANGGGSMKDEVRRCLLRLEFIDQRQVALLQDHELAIVQCDEKGDASDVNRTYRRWLNCTKDESLGQRWRKFIHPEDKDRLIEDWTEAVADTADVVLRFRFLSAHDETIPVIARCYAIRSEKGKGLGWICMIERTDKGVRT